MNAVRLIELLSQAVQRVGDKEVKIVLPNLENLIEPTTLAVDPSAAVDDLEGSLIDIRGQFTVDAPGKDGSIWIHLDPPVE